MTGPGRTTKPASANCRAASGGRCDSAAMTRYQSSIPRLAGTSGCDTPRVALGVLARLGPAPPGRTPPQDDGARRHGHAAEHHPAPHVRPARGEPGDEGEHAQRTDEEAR